MATGVEEATALAVFAEVADKLSNAVQGIDTLVGWAKAQEGVKYNSHAFSFPAEEEKEEQEDADEDKSASSSAATPNQSGGKSSSLGVTSSRASVFSPRGQLRSLMVIRVKGKDLTGGKVPGGIPIGGGLLQFSIALRESNGLYFDNGQVILVNASGFDSALGTQAEIEFGGEPWRSGKYLLTFSGQINPFGEGFRRIVGGVIVSKRGELTPHGSWETGSTSRNSAFSDNLGWLPGVGFNIQL